MRVDFGSDPTDEQLPLPPPETPEQAMLAAMLIFAIREIDSRIPEERAAAREWLFGEDCGGVGFSFELVCEHLDLDPDQVRELVRQRKRGLLLGRGPRLARAA